MGAQVSALFSTVQTDLTTQAFNSCPQITASNTLDISNVQFLPNSACKTSSATFNQSAGIDATCLISSLQDSVATTLSSMDATTQGGFGIQASTSASNINSQISQQTINTCGAQSSTNAASIKDTIITACDWHFVQNATAKSSCQINALQKMANDVSVKQTALAQGATLASLLFGNGAIGSIVMGLVVVIILGSIGYYFYSEYASDDKDENDAHGKKSGNKSGKRKWHSRKSHDDYDDDNEGYDEDDEGDDNRSWHKKLRHKIGKIGRKNGKKHKSRGLELQNSEGGGWNLFGNVADDSSMLGSMGKRKYSLLMIGLLLLVCFFIMRSKNKSTSLSESDLIDLKNNMNDAHKIAGLYDTHNTNIYPKYDIATPSDSYKSPRVSEVFEDYSYNLYSGDDNLDNFYKPLLAR
jgi:hypothetical protein